MSTSTLSTRIRKELSTWSSLAFVLALVEGGVIGVLIKNGFDGQVSDWLLNLSVAVGTGAPSYSNLISFIWVKISHGKSKTKLVSNLAIICCLCTLGISFVPFSSAGLVLLLLLLIFARVCWSGILTIRSNIWRANYPRYIRGKVTAKLATFTSLLMSLAAMSVGWMLDWSFSAFKWLFIGFSILSLFGAYQYRFLSVRHHQRSLKREQTTYHKMSLSKILMLLTQNKAFGKYMLAMFTLGSGNLMFMAPLIVYLSEYTELTKSNQIMITTAIPLALIPIAVSWWARVLDSNHIFHFRAIHSWGFVISISMFLVAQLTDINWLYFIGACCYGIAISGAVIGWNLGHNDFVSQSSQGEKTDPMEYMAVHVSLTGLRGVIAPLLGIGFYQWLESIEPQLGRYALLLPLLITTTGGLLFVRFNRQRIAGHFVTD